ncbi:MAG: hypothetical protein DMG57_20815 [Acidobacteria bacterium]|nr:MAG: hypothetical protein DMG57_20815 [Acidobacteriota bacterium]
MPTKRGQLIQAYLFRRDSLIFLLLWASSAYAQFSGSIEGIVQDPSGGSIPSATVTLLSKTTHLTKLTTSDASGNYRFVSLAPDEYQITANARGFSENKVDVSLRTSQTLALALSLKLTTAEQSVEVTERAPVLNVAESRNQQTLATQELQSLPLAGRSLLSLVTLAPGVTGLGTVGFDSPGSAADNYSTEARVDASANGINLRGNMYIVDGLDVTSNYEQGTLNLIPNPDAIQEASVQTNTFAVDYGRASSIQMVMTTRSGTDTFHGTASDYFNSQQLWAGTEFAHNYAPFHSNNVSATLGGPIIPHHGSFFFFAIEPLWSSNSTGASTVTYEAPEFTAWAQKNFPNTVGTKLLTGYGPSNAATTGVAQTAAEALPGSCGTGLAPPCNLPVFDTGIFSATNYRNGMQYNLRVDQYFKNDRIYGNFFRTTLNTNGPNVRPKFNTTNDNQTKTLQVNEIHTFSPSALNEAMFGFVRVRGNATSTGDFTVPQVYVQGLGAAFGDGYAMGAFAQPNYHWRDVLNLSRGSHSLRFGIESWHGQALSLDGPTRAQPSFSFTDMLNLVKDQPYTESNLAYEPLTGQPALNTNYGYAATTVGVFAQDTWKISKNMTINYGLRWDDFGNPYPVMKTVLADFHFGAGQSLDQQIANGFFQQQHHLYNHALANIFSPRFGMAWDPTGHGTWVVRGGFGIYHEWPNLGNTANAMSGNPPGFIVPTFFGGTANPPIFALGTSNKFPFGFPYPGLPATGLDSHGGLLGAHPYVQGIDQNLTAPTVYIFTTTAERSLRKDWVASIGYVGQRGSNLVPASRNNNYSTGYFAALDINQFPGDLIQCNCSVPQRLNSSFGQIIYARNAAESAYNAVIVAVRGRFGARGGLNASYTHSRTYDDAGYYPTAIHLHQYWGPSAIDIPNRFSLSWDYELPGLNSGHGLVGRITTGWTISGTTILQSGGPFTVVTYAPFLPLRNSSGQIIGFAPGSGDFSATGDNFAYPNVTSYRQATNRQGYLNGIFAADNFPNPALGSQGNEKINAFRNPGFAGTNAALSKDTAISERIKLQLRFEFYNIFNRVNLGFVDSNLTDTTFGRSTSQFNPRWIQLGARITF